MHIFKPTWHNYKYLTENTDEINHLPLHHSSSKNSLNLLLTSEKAAKAVVDANHNVFGATTTTYYPRDTSTNTTRWQNSEKRRACSNV